jgi:hypothetical protein
MSNSGWGCAPGSYDDVDGMIAAVSDTHVRDTLSRMQAENRRFQEDHSRQIQSFSSILLSVAADVRALASKSNYAPPLPQYIAAAGDSPVLRSLTPSDSQTSSFTPPSSLTDKTELAAGNSRSAVVLKCLFCTHYHVIEKSHCQHYTRLRDRFVNSEQYNGPCSIPRDHWIFRNFGTAGQDESEIVQNFIQKYLSHLASSNEKNVNPQRAAQLCAWLETIPRS